MTKYSFYKRKEGKEGGRERERKGGMERGREEEGWMKEENFLEVVSLSMFSTFFPQVYVYHS